MLYFDFFTFLFQFDREPLCHPRDGSRLKSFASNFVRPTNR